MASCYDLLMSPLERCCLAGLRQRLISQAAGEVLELGARTGANLPYYRWDRLTGLTLSDLVIDAELLRVAPPEATVRRCAAEQLPFPTASFDTVVETLVLCSVSSVREAVAEIYRVLRPGGCLLWLDHGLPQDGAFAQLLQLLNRFWPRWTGGCQLNRRMEREISTGGLVLEQWSGGDAVFRYGVARKPVQPN